MKRLAHFDLLKLLTIFFVVYGHSMQFMMDHDFFHNPVFEFIYSFHMPLFMILSGYFSLRSFDLSFPSLLKKKFVQLILPCISWSLLVSVLAFLGQSLYLGDWQSLPLLLGNLSKGILFSFWFLRSLFVCYLVVFVFLKLFSRVWLAALVSILLMLFLGTRFNVDFLLPYFWIGMLMNKRAEFFNKHLKTLIVGSLILFGIGLIFWDGSYTIYKTPLYIVRLYFKSRFFFIPETAVYFLGIGLYRFFLGLFGSWFFIYLFQYLHQRLAKKEIGPWTNRFSQYGQYTLGIYILQTYLLEFLSNRFKFSGVNFWLYDLVLTPVVALLVLAVSIFILKQVKKNRYLNLFFMGKMEWQTKILPSS